MLQHRSDFVIYSDVLEYFGGDNKKSRNDYRVFIEEGLLKELGSPFQDVKGQVTLGEQSFVEWIYENVLKEKKTGKIEQSVSNELRKEVKLDFLIDKICEVFGVKRTDILKRRSEYREARMALIDLCCKYRLFHKRLREIGQELGGLTVGEMSQARKRLRCKLQRDKDLKVKFNRCIEFIESE